MLHERPARRYRRMSACRLQALRALYPACDRPIRPRPSGGSWRARCRPSAAYRRCRCARLRCARQRLHSAAASGTVSSVEMMACGFAAITASMLIAGASSLRSANTLRPPHSSTISLMICRPFTVYSGRSSTSMNTRSGARSRYSLAQLLDARFVIGRRALGNFARARELGRSRATRSPRARGAASGTRRPQLQRTNAFDGRRGSARFPDEHHVGPQRQQSLQIDAECVADAGNVRAPRPDDCCIRRSRRCDRRRLR